MNRSTLSLLLALVFSCTACKKDTLRSGQNSGTGPLSGYSFANTDWAGVMQTGAQEYQQPMCMHISDDSTVSVYALFAFFEDNNLVTLDSLIGRITSIDTVTYSLATIIVNYPRTNDQHRYAFYKDNTIRGGSFNSSATTSAQFTPLLSLCPKIVPPVQGKWTTPALDSSNLTPPVAHMYPDLVNIFFNQGFTGYERGGQPVTGPVPGKDILPPYTQIGRRVYFYGYNEVELAIVPYFGIIMSDGASMGCDTRAEGARVPNYSDNFQHYGPNGSTPVMHRVQ